MIRRRRSWFVAAVAFLVVQLIIVPSRSAKNISTTTSYDIVNHHNRQRGKEYRRNNNWKNSSVRLSKLDRHDITTYDDNKLVTQVHFGSTRRDISGNDEEHSKGKPETKHLNLQASSAPYISAHRKTRDVEDIFNEMAHKDPQEWTAIDWIALLLFLTMFCWIYSCLCSLCCCSRRGGGGGSTILNWLCCYEICFRDGRDLEVCCDYATATLV
eukprot:scaffold9061_cov140-Skeletonema_dohrnii-CCMP3373.AAC.9